MAGLCGYLSLAVAERQQSDILQTLIGSIRRSVVAGIESGVSDKSFDQIIEQVRHELKNNSA